MECYYVFCEEILLVVVMGMLMLKYREALPFPFVLIVFCMFQVSHVVFWHRYFYKVHQLEAAEEMRQMLKQRAEKPNTDSDDIVWDEGETFISGFILMHYRLNIFGPVVILSEV